MKDRNMPYPVYPMPNGMPCPPMNGMMPPPMPPYKGYDGQNGYKGYDGYKNHDMIEQKLASLDKRVTHLENVVGSTNTNYASSNFQIM